MTTATDTTVHQTVQAMIDEIGKLRQLVAIDNMPTKLQQVRQLLRELDAEFTARANVTSYYEARASGVHANRAR